MWKPSVIWDKEQPIEMPSWQRKDNKYGGRCLRSFSLEAEPDRNSGTCDLSRAVLRRNRMEELDNM